MNKTEVLERYNTLMETGPGMKHYRMSKNFQRDLYKNPQVVSSIAFDDTIDAETKMDILFVWSKDHTGSCWIKDNPRWADMMRNHIIPGVDALPEEFRYLIKWYQEVHGL